MLVLDLDVHFNEDKVQQIKSKQEKRNRVENDKRASIDGRLRPLKDEVKKCILEQKLNIDAVKDLMNSFVQLRTRLK